MSTPWKVGIGVVVVALLALGVWRYAQAVERAEAADERADSAVAAAEREAGVSDSLESLLDVVSEREEAVRDSLNRALREAEADADVAEGETVEAGEHLAASLDSLARSVRPALRPVVQTARSQADSALSAHERFRVAMQRQVRLLASDTLSLHRELAQTNETLAQVRVERDTLREALALTAEARDRWKEAATLRIFGLPPELTHGLAAAAGFGIAVAAR